MMKLIDKIIAKQSNAFEERQPVVVFFGDDITHGCFETFVKNGRVGGVNGDAAYPEKFKKIFSTIYPEVPITVINAGISGDCAKNARGRIERDCLSYNPDLVVVCFGMNDAMSGKDGIDEYRDSLKEIFNEIHKGGSDIIFMTPNMRAKVNEAAFAEDTLTPEMKKVIKNEDEHWLDTYIYAARSVCRMEGIIICDCNRMWKALARNGADISALMANKISLPTETMHWLFAYELARTIFDT